MLKATAADLTQRISHATLAELQSLVAPAEISVNLMSYDTLTSASSFADRWQRLRYMHEALVNSPSLSSIYVGYASGDFFLLRSVRGEAERRMFKAPEGTRYIVQSIERGVTPPRGRFIFLDSMLKTLREDDRPEYAASYDPRKQEWYWEAEVGSSQNKTLPYLLLPERKVGMTLAARAQNNRSMIGADILLDTLSASLSRQKVTPHTQMVSPGACHRARGRGETGDHAKISRCQTRLDTDG
jgi:hypothetical protein